jgi:hypothetical protein
MCGTHTLQKKKDSPHLTSPYIYICKEEIKWMRNYQHIIYIYARRKRERKERGAPFNPSTRER